MNGQAVLRDVVLPLAAGAVLGLFYFGGLWWTTQRIGRVRQPALLLLGSFVVRMAVILAGLWVVTGGRMKGTALFMAAVLGARQATLAWAQAATARARREAVAPGQAACGRAGPEEADLPEAGPQEADPQQADPQEIGPQEVGP
ncbi:MAG TPA: ATP synthase subunit I [Limnochordales bacterium]